MGEWYMHVTDPGVTGRAPTDQLLPARAVQARYQIVDRTLDRWLANPELGFPRPITVNKRRYFRVSDLEAWERERAAAQSAA
jgi:hypothetical protein